MLEAAESTAPYFGWSAIEIHTGCIGVVGADAGSKVDTEQVGEKRTQVCRQERLGLELVVAIFWHEWELCNKIGFIIIGELLLVKTGGHGSALQRHQLGRCW